MMISCKYYLNLMENKKKRHQRGNFVKFNDKICQCHKRLPFFLFAFPWFDWMEPLKRISFKCHVLKWSKPEKLQILNLRSISLFLPNFLHNIRLAFALPKCLHLVDKCLLPRCISQKLTDHNCDSVPFKFEGLLKNVQNSTRGT